MDDGFGNGFITIAGGSLGQYLETQAVISQNINDGGYTINVQRGNFYKFQYRGQNVVGWGPFSPISVIQAATIPDPP